ncbi:hypothetical protein KG112_03290 [Nocardioides sp. zg-ZUI104]|uniref:divisome protein SepX/GlpR n=1 Tax=Nocardioides faecalis TaxID=2803858 RepID=UPI001BCF270E|nr:hypothetical protein [Nocardioides faecalis]MBS4751831.1 hypothetical protein [Nocardioides faecalis]
MDLSALIFVALAVAWAVYLVPMALRQHEEDDVSRSVDGFSDRLRVLARREPISATKATLVRLGERRTAAADDPADNSADDTADDADKAPATPTPASREHPVERVEQVQAARTARDLPPAQRAKRRAAARRAAQRRRRVLGVLLLANLVLVALATPGLVHAAWTAVPATLLVAWLVACRLMVKRERRVRTSSTVRTRRAAPAEEAPAAEKPAEKPVDAPSAEAAAALEDEDVVDDETGEIAAVTDETAGETGDETNGWTPVEVPLPTYVAKAPAGRTVRTIDLDSTGVWSSGRNEADSQLAREADAQRAQAETAEDEQRRAAGS